MNLKDIDRKLGDMMKEEKIVNKHLDIPFKDFMPGQIIQSSQFNDDMLDIEDKVNEIIDRHNLNVNKLHEHLDDKENPHEVNPHQIGTYESSEIDDFIKDVKNGNLNDEAIINRVLADGCVDNRVLQDGAVTVSKVDSDLGSQLDLESNISIVSRYTKDETDAIIQEKVGDGTYSKEQIDAKFEEYQAGTIVDGTIDVSKLKDSVGRQIDITNNPSISDRYTKTEVDTLIYKNGLPKDWGGLNDSTDEDEGITPSSAFGHLPISDVMTCGEFRVNETDVLNVKIQDVEFAKGDFSTLEGRLDDVDNKIDNVNGVVNNNATEIGSVKNQVAEHKVHIDDYKYAFSKKLINGTGYYTLPGGLIIQWGSRSIASGETTYDEIFNFPIKFPTYCVNLNAMPFGGDNNWDSHCSGHALDATRARIVLRGNNVNFTNKIFWIAIGY